MPELGEQPIHVTDSPVPESLTELSEDEVGNLKDVTPQTLAAVDKYLESKMGELQKAHDSGDSKAAGLRSTLAFFRNRLDSERQQHI